jgi:hypothetical protein
MPLRLIVNDNYIPRVTFTARLRRLAGAAANGFKSAWLTAFPTHSPDDPGAPPTIAKAAALREAAMLADDVDAVAKKRLL